MTPKNRNILIGVLAAIAVVAILAYVARKERTQPPANQNPPITTSTPTSTPPATTTPPIVTTTPPIVTTTPPIAPTSTPLTTEQQVRSRATATMQALKARNVTNLTPLIHPTKGVRVSLNGYVDTAKDKVFTRAQLTQYFNTNVKFTWGVQEGSGEPVVLSIKDLLNKYVYNKDFVNAQEVLYDTYKGQTSSINNAAQVYPNAHIVQFYFPGFDPQYEGLDWQAVRVVLEKSGAEWYVVGLIHDHWGG